MSESLFYDIHVYLMSVAVIIFRIFFYWSQDLSSLDLGFFRKQAEEMEDVRLELVFFDTFLYLFLSYCTLQLWKARQWLRANSRFLLWRVSIPVKARFSLVLFRRHYGSQEGAGPIVDSDWWIEADGLHWRAKAHAFIELLHLAEWECNVNAGHYLLTKFLCLKLK